MEPYRHTVQYYETDKMGIVHHANYIRWMEEARVDFLRQIGWPFQQLEAMGILSPVMYVDCRYRASTLFPETVEIKVWIEKFHGVRLVIGYEMRKPDGSVACLAHSEHCFTDRDGHILRMQKAYPAIYDAFAALAQEAPADAPR